MIQRQISSSIKKSLNNFPVVSIVGPRQVGKTTLAKNIISTLKNAIYLDLELPSDYQKLENAQLYLTQFENRLVVIDEVQRKPELFPLLRAIVDQKRRPGRFLLLGSSSPKLHRQASESLAGRIVYHELSSFNLLEVGDKSLQKLWLHGGFPESFLNDNEISMQWRSAFINTYIEKDIYLLGYQVSSTQLRRFWSMLAHHHGQLWNASTVANSLGSTPPTVRHYLDILQDGFLVRQIQPYFTNIGKRLVKTPKMYIRDSGLLHTLLKIDSYDSLLGHPALGASWEGFVVEQIISLIPANADYFFYRTASGIELDLLVISSAGKIGFEIKYSLSPKLTKGFWNSMDDIGCDKAYIVYPGEEIYPLDEKVTVLPITQLINVFRQKEVMS